jgi:ABC-type nickel/cobalt efflux system permease component RcnA
VAAVLAMGLGTALITLAVALVGAKFGQHLLSDAGGLRLRRIADLAQILIGFVIVVLYL